MLPEHVIEGRSPAFADVYVWEPNTYSGVSMEEELERSLSIAVSCIRHICSMRIG